MTPDAPPIGAFVVNPHDGNGDALEDAAGFIATVAKNQQVFFTDLLVALVEAITTFFGDGGQWTAADL